jgi:hypothetical protein
MDAVLRTKDFYKRQSTAKGVSAEEVLAKINELQEGLFRALPGRKFDRPMDVASLRGSLDLLQREYLPLGYFVDVGVDFANSKYYLSVEILKLSDLPLEFEQKTFVAGEFRFPVPEGVQARAIEKHLCDRYERTAGNLATGKELVPLGVFERSVNLVLVSPQVARDIAIHLGVDSERIVKTALLNELGHAALHPFLDPLQEQAESADPTGAANGKGKPLNFKQINEAFSDYVSIRYGPDLVLMLHQLAEPSTESYQFSYELMQKGVAAVLQAGPAVVDLSKIDRSNGSTATLTLNKYLLENPARVERVRAIIATTYEQHLVQIFGALKDAN